MQYAAAYAPLATQKQLPPPKAKRPTLEKKSVEIPISRTIQLLEIEVKLDLPAEFLAYEPSPTRSRLSSVWQNQVLRSMCELIRKRKSRLVNKDMRKLQFRRNLKNLLDRFNELTENVKVEFHECHHLDSFASTTYYLDFILYNPAAGSVQDAPCCVAELPVPAPLITEVAENYNRDVAPVSKTVQGVDGQQHLPSGNFSAITQTSQLDDIPVAVAVATLADSHSFASSRHPPASGVPEVELLRREIDELRMQNESLRSQSISSSANSATVPLVSSEVLESRREAVGGTAYFSQSTRPTKV
jgi:hypothetical protein